MAFEGVESARPAAKPARCRIVLGRLAVTRKFHADVIEHAVQQYPQPPSPRFGDQVVEIIVVAEPRVDAVVVGGVVTVCARGEDRPQRDPRGAELDSVVEPLGDAA